jgi:hypothetical protein
LRFFFLHTLAGAIAELTFSLELPLGSFNLGVSITYFYELEPLYCLALPGGGLMVDVSQTLKSNCLGIGGTDG